MNQLIVSASLTYIVPIMYERQHGTCDKGPRRSLSLEDKRGPKYLRTGHWVEAATSTYSTSDNIYKGHCINALSNIKQLEEKAV